MKWGHDYPDMYSRSAAATVPDWYSRRLNTVRKGDSKELNWVWDQPSKPTQRKTFGMGTELQKPCVQRGHQASPHDVEGQVTNSRFALYHPAHYQEPARAEALPSVH